MAGWNGVAAGLGFEFWPETLGMSSKVGVMQ